jgi:two-component system chemotaxis response regulator CheY
MPAPVLIVDDSAMIRSQVNHVLSAAGFEVLEAVDGVDALEKLASSEVSLVVCDINMPRMNGLEFLQNLRSGAERATVPVLMLTTQARPELIRRARELGAKGWIVKPFQATVLVAAARKLAMAT